MRKFSLKIRPKTGSYFLSMMVKANGVFGPNLELAHLIYLNKT